MNPAPISSADVELVAPQPQQDFRLEDLAVGQERIRFEAMQLDNDMKSLAYFKDLAASLKKSGAIKADGDSDPEALAILKMQLGKEMGMPAGQALKDIYVIKGVPSVSAHFKAQKMRVSGYTWSFLKHDETECHIALFRGGVEIGKVRYTIEDARRAKLVKDDKDDSNWIKTPLNMLYARCISNAQRWFAPETQGAGYPAPEEIDLDAVVSQTTMQAETNKKAAALANKLSAVKGNGATAEATI
jgi:hypothetical protein